MLQETAKEASKDDKMKERYLYIRLSDDTLHQSMERYHYQDQPKLYKEVYKDLIHGIRPFLLYEYDYFDRNNSLFIVSLGKGPDTLLEAYEETGAFSKALALEGLCLDLLSECYRQIAEIVLRERKIPLSRLEFADTIEAEEYLKKLPSKSVLFHGISGSGSCKKLIHDCENCSFRDCIFRKK